jgi:hypothetical protein
MTKKQMPEPDPEIAAIGAVYRALGELGPEAQARVLNYVSSKLKIEVPIVQPDEAPFQAQHEDAQDAVESHVTAEDSGAAGVGLEGISPVARRWMTRNGLQPQALATIFSLGVDEIDLVAKTVPGKNKKEKMHNVFLLKGIAAYIGTGAPRFTHEQLKETCLHYQAYDSANFAAYLKTFSSEASGDKRTGYTLTPRGLTNATELVKKILQPAQSR